MGQKSEKNNIILSICIPTYNRASLLKEALDSIFAQVNELNRDKVEIVVADNSSNRETAALVEKIRGRAPVTINYHKNENNIGFDRNLLKVVELARGKYCWPLGDDDLLAEGALAAVCKELERSQEIDIFLGEKEDFYLTPDRPMRRRRIMDLQEARVFDFHQPQELDNYFCSNQKLIAFLNYISIVVFSRKRWLGVKQKENFVGTGYIHVYVLQMLLWGPERGMLKYLPFALTRRRWGTDPDYNLEEKLRMDFQMFHQIAAAVFAERKYIWLIDDRVIRNDGFSWAVRVKINEPVRFLTVHLPFLIKRYWDHPLFWVKIFPLILAPGFVLRLLRGTYRRLVKGESFGMREFFEG